MADWDAFLTAMAAPTASTREPELLYELVRVDHLHIACWLKFRGESYGWEAQILRNGELFASRGGFVTKALAKQWAEIERPDLEKGDA